MKCMTAKPITPGIILLILIDVSLFVSLVFHRCSFAQAFSKFQVISPEKGSVYCPVSDILVDDCFGGIWYCNIEVSKGNHK